MRSVQELAGTLPTPSSIAFSADRRPSVGGVFVASPTGDISRTSILRRLLLVGVGASCIPLSTLAIAADGSTSPAAEAASSQTSKAPEGASSSSTQSEVEALRNELRELRKELQQLKETTSANDTRLRSFSEKFENIGVNSNSDTSSEYATKSDLEALRDVQDENTIRSVGSSSSISSYQVNGNKHLISLTGYASLGYSAGFDALAKSSQTFKLSGIGINLTGSLRSNPGSDGDVNYKVGLIASPTTVVNSVTVVSTAKTSGTKTVVTNTVNTPSTKASYVNLGDVYATYDVKTTKLELEPSWTLQFQVGQYLTPYGIDPVATEDQIPTINKAQYVSKLGFGRDIGVTANGTFFNVNDPSAVTTPVIAYNLGVYNGSGPNAVDTNRSIDLLGRVVLSPFPQYFSTFRNLKFGGNWYEGNLGQDHDDLPTRRRYGGDVAWLRKPFLLNFEYVHSQDGYSGYSTNINDTTVTWPSPTAAYKESDSYVATLFWTPSTLPDFQPWIRYDRFKPTAFDGLNAASTLLGNTQTDIYSIGFNWFIWSVEPVISRSYSTQQTNRVLKLQLGYDYIDQQNLTKARHQVNGVVTYNF